MDAEGGGQGEINWLLGGVLTRMEATKGAMSLGKGHGDHWKLVDWKHGRGPAGGSLRGERGQLTEQSWTRTRMYGLRTGGAGWLEVCQGQGERLPWGSAT